MATPAAFDCMRCGACCCNPDINRKHGHVNYVEIDEGDAILKKPGLMRRLVFLDKDDIPHMRLDASPSQKCVALEGDIGDSVACTIYAFRPSGCRRVEPGDEECLRARRDRGVDPPLKPKRSAKGRS